jgi:hypothetical protein
MENANATAMFEVSRQGSLHTYNSVRLGQQRLGAREPVDVGAAGALGEPAPGVGEG